MYFDDLTPYSYRSLPPTESVLTVGWIDKVHSYSTGTISSEFLQKLKSIILCQNDVFDAHVNVIRGMHPCNLCDVNPELIGESGRYVPLGMSEIWIPYGDEKWFASPSMIYHYVETHQYLPPNSYVEAIYEVNVSEHYQAQEIYDKLARSSQRSEKASRKTL